MYRLIFLSLLVTFNLFAKECKLDYSIMYLIAMNERHPQRNIGYPYLISFNNKKDAKIARKYFNEFIDSRTMDCKNKDKCVEITKILIEANITNLDLGAFQISYRHHKHKIFSYYDLKKSYNIGCLIAQRNIDLNNIKFSDIAKYNSFKKKRNRAYAKKIQRNYLRLKSKIGGEVD